MSHEEGQFFIDSPLIEFCLKILYTNVCLRVLGGNCSCGKEVVKSFFMRPAGAGGSLQLPQVMSRESTLVWF